MLRHAARSAARTPALARATRTPTTRSFAALASFATCSLIAITACDLEVDETGGRPVESTSATTSSVTPVTVGSTVAPVSTVSRTTTAPTAMPTDVSFKDADGAFRDKRYSDAMQMFDSYTTGHPDNAWGHYMLGLSAWKYGELERARIALERAVELSPNHVKSLLNLSRVYLELGQPKEARTRVTAARKLDSTSAEVHRLMGRVHTELKQNEEAIMSYRVALSLDPNDVWSMNNMGLILVQQQRFAEALGPLARATSLDSTTAVFQNNLGIVLEHMGSFTLAGQAYERAIAADSGYRKAAMSLARISGRMDDLGVAPVDLVTVAQTFDRDVRTKPIGYSVAKKDQDKDQDRDQDKDKDKDKREDR